jgi:hypothetical protein
MPCGETMWPKYLTSVLKNSHFLGTLHLFPHLSSVYVLELLSAADAF